MTNDGNGNPRFVLRAFTETDACRLARIIVNTNMDRVPGDAIHVHWADMYPRHATLTGSRRISRRITNALWKLSIAGAIRRERDDVVVVNADLLGMASRNLDIVEDGEGVAVPPGQWSRRPEVPAHLQHIEDALSVACCGEFGRTGITHTVACPV